MLKKVYTDENQLTLEQTNGICTLVSISRSRIANLQARASQLSSDSLRAIALIESTTLLPTTKALIIDLLQEVKSITTLVLDLLATTSRALSHVSGWFCNVQDKQEEIIQE